MVDEIQSARLTRAANLEDYQGSEENLKKTLEWLNEIELDKMTAIINSAVNGILGTVRYERLEQAGPRKGKFSMKAQICTKFSEC